MSRTARILVALGGVVVIVILTGFLGCSTTGSGDFVGRGAEALDRTAGTGRTAVEEAPGRVEEGTDRFLSLFDVFTAEAVREAALQVYADDAYFNDGFAELDGAEAIADYLARSAGHTRELEIDLEETTRTGAGVYVRWVMRFTTTGGKTVTAPGISHVRFDPDGRVVYHRDHWDASGALAHLVPFVQKILDAVRSRL